MSKSTVSPIYSTSKSTVSQKLKEVKIHGQSEIEDIKRNGQSEIEDIKSNGQSEIQDIKSNDQSKTQGRQNQRSVKDPGKSKATVSWRYKDTKSNGHSEKQNEKKINGQSHSVPSPNNRWVVFFLNLPFITFFAKKSLQTGCYFLSTPLPPRQLKMVWPCVDVSSSNGRKHWMSTLHQKHRENSIYTRLQNC